MNRNGPLVVKRPEPFDCTPSWNQGEPLVKPAKDQR